MRLMRITLALIVLAQSGCATLGPRALGNDRRHWTSDVFPIPIRHDTRCVLELTTALMYIEEQVSLKAGYPVDLFLFVPELPFDSMPPYGEIWFIDGHTSDWVMAETEGWAFIVQRDRMYSALVTQSVDHDCHWQVLAHEALHAMGLPHNPNPDYLMYERYMKNATRISESELKHLIDSYEGRL